MKYDDMNFEEKELSILRKAVDEITSQTGKKIMNSPEITKIIIVISIFIVLKLLESKKLHRLVNYNLQLLKETTFSLKSNFYLIQENKNKT